MKGLFLSALILPVAVGIYSWTAVRPPASVEVRSGQWPIHLERTTDRPGVSFSLIFRDQSEPIANVLDTLDFADIGQLRYLDSGLISLRRGTNGDCARYKDYSITRADKKFEGTYYILRADYGQTVFRQPEADIIGKAIKDW
jgi:hypothetical protein